MILYHHRQALLVRIERHPLGHGPAFEGAVVFEAQVVMQAGGVMFLHNETQRSCGPLDRAFRLGSAGEMPFRLVLAEAHR